MYLCVYQAQRKDSGKRFAVKMIERANPAFDVEALRKEIDTMQRINHPNCIRLHDVFEEEKYICLVLDLVTGGELFDRIIARGHYSEKDAAEVSKEVLLAVAYLHAQGIVHRDLKPENLLYMSNDENTREYKHIKVADFGLARSFPPSAAFASASLLLLHFLALLPRARGGEAHRASPPRAIRVGPNVGGEHLRS